MSSPGEGVSPATTELAGMMERDLLAGVAPDIVFDIVRDMAPSAWIGYAAMALTNEPNKHAAVLHLFHDQEVQEQVLAHLDALFAAQVTTEGLLAASTERMLYYGKKAPLVVSISAILTRVSP